MAASKPETGTILTPREARVLACLMEKQLTVPDSYPLTLNTLTLACNQKSNREPRMQLPEGEVGHIAKALEARGLIRIEYGERAHKFEHTARKLLNLDRRQQALLTIMMLRAPQTLNDLRTRSKRMAEFTDIDDILLTLERLNDRDQPLVQHIPKGPGQREDRYTHLLCGPVDIEKAAPASDVLTPSDNDSFTDLHTRIENLEKRIARLEALFDAS